ncbi:DUF932 domain-containing protein [Rudaeicoccus suwonensis]|uniref:Phage/plasmid-like protein (TIGR03299 family) n=1 Tax=Rudaeicoccus suwonensis TaxID=657409 RepID=A0A561DVG4_9MICO|nr:DUF932 domain-containing protein [Rudaeicoccus suwonensis]TWE07349.1 phage/plasmid-like protein (TIGR03299 family) [Rudaeicoccus suwonensis]
MHQIETHGRQAAAVFARKDAWHKLGTTVQGRAFTAQEAMELGHLGGWNVRKLPLTATEVTVDGVTTVDVPSSYATVRDNPFTNAVEALGVVGEQYQPIQNEEHAEFLNHLVDESGAIFDTAGSLRGGRQTFITLQMPETMRVGGVDDVSLNIAALNSHDGSSAFRLLLTPVRVVCANTQAAALRNHCARVSIRHTSGATNAVQQARTALGMTFEYFEEFEREAEAMIQASTTDAQFYALMEQVFGKAERDDSPRAQKAAATRTATLASLWHEAKTQDGIRGTRWAAYQVAAEYVDHFAPVRTPSGMYEGQARATRLLTSPEPNRLKTRAWEALMVA